jgi:hypothetical protein
VVTISTPKFVNQVARLQRGAGVEVLHHDIRTVPEPMTAAALAETGNPAPRRPARSGGAQRKPHQGRKPYRGVAAARRHEGRFEGRNDGRRDDRRRPQYVGRRRSSQAQPGRDTPPRKGHGTKQRWSKEQRSR